jgi:outer membrane protein assembly factor BamE (lipoprotein component of BamABCDE complex)
METSAPLTRTTMRRLYILLLLLASCASALEQASRGYKQDRDDKSLQTIANALHKGMRRSDVEALLGPPDYSPTDGQYNYASSRKDHLLVVDYRIETEVTDRLQSFDLMTLGE